MIIRIQLFTCVFIVVSLSVVLTSNVKGNPAFDEQEHIKKLENPISVSFLKSQLRKTSPRLIFTPALERNLKNKIKSDPVVNFFYEAI